jgi:hypothetical protein
MAPRALVDALRADSGPPLFYFASRPLVHLAEVWNFPDAFVRILPYLAILALAFGVRSLPAPGARAAYLVLTGSFALLSFYSAEARAYALLAALDFALFVELRQRRDDLVHGFLVAACTLAALLTHYLAIFFVGSVVVLAIAERRWKKLLGIAAGVVCALPWLPVLAAQPAAATAWMKEPPLRSVVGFFSSLGGVGRVPPAFGASLPAPLVSFGAVAGLLIAAMLVGSARRDPDVRAGAAVVGLTLAGALVAGLVRPVAFAGRTEMAILPVWIWTIAHAAEGRRPLRLAATAASLLGAIAFATALPRMIDAPESTPARVASVLERSAGPDDVVVAATAFYLPLRLARDRGALRAALIGFPGDVERHPGWFLAQPAPPAAYDELDKVLARAKPGSRAWIAVHPLFRTAKLFETLDARGTVRDALSVPDAAVLVWTAR